ncbi:hypothetical protein [Nocardioides cynanchi]|uniref:hypothetical protein n=1 Tax=Nocardioides cynanchi TaxID=2558918 RepID=UPI001243D45D|nr:hypothetical protein [Nocardioides cynanchi]
MTTTTQIEPGVTERWRGAVPVGTALVVAELLLALLWFPWVVDHLVFGSGLSYEVLRLLIVGPEYLLLAVAVYVVARRPALRLPAAGLALLAGLVVWGWSILASHIAHTQAEVATHRHLLDTLSWIAVVAVPTLAALAWGVARRRGGLWLLAVPVAPALHWWFERSDWKFRIQIHFDFRGSEVVGMTFVIIPVLLAILAGWALEQVDPSASPTP